VRNFFVCRLIAIVTARIRDGDAALEQLYIDNQPLTDYLRAQAAKK